LQLAFQADDLYLKGGAYNACGVAFFRKAYSGGGRNLKLAVEMTQKTDFVGMLLQSFCFLGVLRHEMGRYREAQECFDGLLAVYERVRMCPSMARFAGIAKVAAGVRGRLNPPLDAGAEF